MKAIDLNSIPYKHRFNGASLLIAKANRLGDLAAVYHYDMALALLKPFDPGYSTVLNWKCNVLRALGQYEEAVSCYREILRLAYETEGGGQRNATAKHAEEMIQKYEGRNNEPLETENADTTAFDDPPYCMTAENFCILMSEHKYKKAHSYLSARLQSSYPVPKLRQMWQAMTKNIKSQDMAIALEEHMTEWPAKKPDELGWCYFSISGLELNEAVTLVIGWTPFNSYCITDIEFGRP